MGRDRLARHPLARAVWLVAAWLAVTLGFVGILLPLLPTTPFLLVAAYAFARSSPRLHGWLLDNRTFGPLIRDWMAGHGITLRAKALAVTTVTLSIGTSAAFSSSPAVRVVLAVVGASLCLFLVTRPTRRCNGT